MEIYNYLLLFLLMIENGTGFDLSSYKRELEKKK